MYKLNTKIEIACIPPFCPKFVGRSRPRLWAFRNSGPGIVAIYCGPTGGRVVQRCKLSPGDRMELHAKHIVLQSRDRFGAVVLIAPA